LHFLDDFSGEFFLIVNREFGFAEIVEESLKHNEFTLGRIFEELLGDSLIRVDSAVHVLIDDEFFEDVGIALDRSPPCEVGVELAVVEVEDLLDDGDHGDELRLSGVSRDALVEVKKFVVVELHAPDCPENLVHGFDLVVIHSKGVD
jgi:hypothetical protein